MLSQVYSGDPYNNKTVLVKRGPEKHRSNDLLNHEELMITQKTRHNKTSVYISIWREIWDGILVCDIVTSLCQSVPGYMCLCFLLPHM